MKTLLAAVLMMTVAATASAQPAEPYAPAQPAPQPQPQPQPQLQPEPPPQVAYATPAAEPPALGSEPTGPTDIADEEGWKRPAGRRFVHGFRLGYMYLFNMTKPSREGPDGLGSQSLKTELGLKTPHMMLIGYEGFYRIVGHSWLNVILVGNVSVAGFEQSKPIPAASGLIGFEIQKSFQLGVGVNLTPDAESPSHAIMAVGWTPKVGSIQTPVHFFFVPDPTGSDEMGNPRGGNHRMGATVGMSW